MLRMFARRMSHQNVVNGTDDVLFGISLPSDSVIHDIKVKIQLVGTATNVQDKASMYAVEGWILPVLDPDAASTYNVIWDALVPKDVDVQTMDLDTGGSDTTPFYEPGEADWTALFDVGLRPERVYHRHQLITLAKSLFTFQDNQTPFLINYLPGDTLAIHIRKRFRVRQPSVLVFGIAVPTLDDTTSADDAALSEPQWGQIKYVGHVLERAMLHVLGVVEAGAETPWEEATALLQAHLDPDIVEQDAGAFALQNFDVFTEAIIDHSVVGELPKQAITTGR